MNAMPMAPSAMTAMTAVTALISVAMMVAMMLPSFAPSLWRYHRQLRATAAPRAFARSVLYAAGYVSVWSTIGLALWMMSAKLYPMCTGPSAEPPFAPSVVGAVLVCAGIVQRSGWKARRLARCRVCVTVQPYSKSVITAWRSGCRLGVDCAASCAGLMAIAFVAGLMDVRMMLLITVAIAAERVAPAGPRMARVTGAVAMIVGVAMGQLL